jgi:ankyrin repeat protein
LFVCRQWKLYRYRCEPALEVLLRESKAIGFVGDISDIVAAGNTKPSKPSLLDIADYNDNTPLHWAAARRNVSMVGMLVDTNHWLV